jgi:hypothetical protein
VASLPLRSQELTIMIETPAAPTTSQAAASRSGPAAAFVAAAGFVVEGVIALVHKTGDDDWDGLSQVLNAAYVVGSIALIVALPVVGRWLRINRAGRLGVIAAQVGFAAMAVESVASGVHDGNTLGRLFFGGLLLSLIGLLVLGIADLMSGAVRWAAMLPFLGLLVGIAGGDHGGSIVLGAVWVLLGVAFMRAES